MAGALMEEVSTTVLQVVTHLGEIQLFLLASVALYWCYSPLLGSRLWAALCLSSQLQQALKMALAQPRPYWLDPTLTPIEKSTSFGMPSGHAQTPPVFYGLLAHFVRRHWAYALAAVIVLATGWTRVAGNVHSVEQVLSGWGIGLGLLILLILIEAPVRRWWRANGRALRLIAVTGLSLAMVAAGLWAALLAETQTVLQLWVSNAGHPIDPVKIKNVLLVPGLFGGWFAGLALLDTVDEKLLLSWAQRLYRLGIGLPPVAALFVLLPDDEQALLWPVIFLLGAAVGGWSSYGAPRLFRLLKI